MSSIHNAGVVGSSPTVATILVDLQADTSAHALLSDTLVTQLAKKLRAISF